MASEQGSTGRPKQHKRLARAKIKRPATGETSAKGSKKRPAQEATPAAKGASATGASRSTRARTTAQAARMQEAERREESKARTKRIGIAIFAIVIALSMMLPSLVTIVSNLRRSEPAEAATSSSATDSSSSSSSDDASSASSDASSSEAADSAEASSGTDSASASSDSASSAEDTATSMVDTIDGNYKTEVDALKKRLDADPKNLAALLNLGKQYMSWGYSVSYYAGGDEAASAHASDLFNQAISYYDQYLALNDSNAVKVDRALCQFYSGDYTAAQTALEKLTTEAPEYGPAWANLGLIYESTYNTPKAEDAYKKAAETDPNDEYGAKSFANQRLASMNESAVTSAQDVVDTSASTTTGLSQTLADASGTSF